MKSEIKEVESKVDKLKFPALMRSVGSGSHVALFSSNANGVVIMCSISNPRTPVGGVAWARANDSGNWERLPAGTQIILTQE